MTILNEDSIPHDCKRILATRDLLNLGAIVQCSCGLVYELRKPPWFFWLLGVGAGNKVTRFGGIQYWHCIEWRDPR